LSFYQTLNPLAKSLGLTIVALNVSAEQSWDLKLSNQIQVILGRVDALKRFQRFVLIYPKIPASSKQTIALIDLRYPNGAAVQYTAP
jgi:cell division protein FtsQ